MFFFPKIENIILEIILLEITILLLSLNNDMYLIALLAKLILRKKLRFLLFFRLIILKFVFKLYFFFKLKNF